MVGGSQAPQSRGRRNCVPFILHTKPSFKPNIHGVARERRFERFYMACKPLILKWVMDLKKIELDSILVLFGCFEVRFEQMRPLLPIFLAVVSDLVQLAGEYRASPSVGSL